MRIVSTTCRIQNLSFYQTKFRLFRTLPVFSFNVYKRSSKLTKNSDSNSLCKHSRHSVIRVSSQLGDIITQCRITRIKCAYMCAYVHSNHLNYAILIAIGIISRHEHKPTRHATDWARFSLISRRLIARVVISITNSISLEIFNPIQSINRT